MQAFHRLLKGLGQEDLPGPHAPLSGIAHLLKMNSGVFKGPGFLQACGCRRKAQFPGPGSPQQKEVRIPHLSRFLEGAKHLFLQGLDRDEDGEGFALVPLYPKVTETARRDEATQFLVEGNELVVALPGQRSVPGE